MQRTSAEEINIHAVSPVSMAEGVPSWAHTVEMLTLPNTTKRSSQKVHGLARFTKSPRVTIKKNVLVLGGNPSDQ